MLEAVRYLVKKNQNYKHSLKMFKNLEDVRQWDNLIIKEEM
jgi:hypothetical protein